MLHLDELADTSEPSALPPGAAVRLRIDGRWIGAVRGVVREVAAAASEDAEDAGSAPREVAHRLLVEAASGATSELLLFLPRGVSPPFVVGEALDARASSIVQGIHPLTDLAIVVAGEARVVRSDRGAPELAAGWSIGPPRLRTYPPPRAGGMAERIDLPVAFRRGRSTGAARGNLWRRLEAADGPWWICGYAVDYGPGNLPPDGGAHASYALIRGPRP